MGFIREASAEEARTSPPPPARPPAWRQRRRCALSHAKPEYTAHYFQGFPKTPNGGISYWNEDLAAQAAGFALNENSSS